jgi:hypothetical protein
MSSATNNGLAPQTALRPVGLIAGIAALEALTYTMADYSTSGGFGAAVPWLLLDLYLLRSIWRGSHTAWFALVALNIGLVALAAMTYFVHNMHMGGGPFLLVRVGLELALLATPAVRRWVAQD